MSRVFFLQQSGRFDVRPAESYGDCIYLFGEHALRSPLNPSGLVDDILARLKELRFDPVDDYIAMTGPVVQLSMFVGVMMSLHDDLRTLVFDARNGKYVVREVVSPKVRNHV